jgi:hypothetical protein
VILAERAATFIYKACKKAVSVQRSAIREKVSRRSAEALMKRKKTPSQKCGAIG